MGGKCKIFTIIGIIATIIAGIFVVASFIANEEKKKKDLIELKRYINGVIR